MRIGLAAWIIQDGNYPDFAVGDVRSFALEFYAQPFSVSEVGVVACTPRKSCIYDICGRITFREGDFTVIDFGRRAYSEQKIVADVDQWIAGQLFLGVDPFMYFESWERQPGVPQIKSEWRINRIFRETTPLIEEKPKYFVRDESQFSEVEVSRTDAWNDDNGNASYALECTETKSAEQVATANSGICHAAIDAGGAPAPTWLISDID